MCRGQVRATCRELKQVLNSSGFYILRTASGWGPEILISQAASSKELIHHAFQRLRYGQGPRPGISKNMKII